MESAINMFDGILYNSSILGDMDGATHTSFEFTFCTKHKRIPTEHGIHYVINSALFSVAFTSRNYTSILPYNIKMSTWTDSPNGHAVN